MLVYWYFFIYVFCNYKNEFIVDIMNCYDYLLCMIYEMCIKSLFLMSLLISVFFDFIIFLLLIGILYWCVWMDIDKDK